MASLFDIMGTDIGAVHTLPCHIADVARSDTDCRAGRLLPGDAIGAIPSIRRRRKASEGIHRIEQRRKRERESARRSRAKRQIRVQALSGRVNDLERKNKTLLEELRSIKTEELVRERDDVFRNLQAALTQREADSMLLSLLQEYDRIGENISSNYIRSIETASHDQLNVSATTLWMSVFVKEQANSRDDVLGLNPWQIDAMSRLKVEYGHQVDDLARRGRNIMTMMEKLEQYRNLMKRVRDIATIFRDDLNKILTPTQRAQVAVWLHRRRALVEDETESAETSLLQTVKS